MALLGSSLPAGGLEPLVARGPERRPPGGESLPTDVIDEHYRRLGSTYDALLHYSPDFVRTLTTHMVDQLRLDPDDALVDLGCGTGMYSVDLLRQVDLREPVVGVDPFPEMLDQIPPDARIEPVAAGALEFSEQPATFDKVLIKEAVHHIDERAALFAQLYERLSPGGVLLLVHVPPTVQYPLFSKALERCLHWHADPDELSGLLADAGFSVARSEVRYRHSIPTEEYLDMVRSRYMSVLSTFSDDELAVGVEEMEAAHAGAETLSFIDHFDYLTATKPEEA